jgi:hypothetical protein
VRRILVNHALARRTQRRGGGRPHLPFDDTHGVASGLPGYELLALGDALEELERLDPRQARLVELRFFGIEAEWRAPLVIFLLGFFAAGTALGIAGVVPTLFRQRREIGRLRRELAAAARTPAAAAAPSPGPDAADGAA